MNYEKGFQHAADINATALIDLSAYQHFPFEQRAWEEGYNAFVLQRESSLWTINQ